jgi:hypothetical protein
MVLAEQRAVDSPPDQAALAQAAPSQEEDSPRAAHLVASWPPEQVKATQEAWEFALEPQE